MFTKILEKIKKRFFREYTGCRDIAGRKIYVGDILSTVPINHPWANKYEVVKRDGVIWWGYNDIRGRNTKILLIIK